MAVCPLATQLSSCARASSARPRTRTTTTMRTETTHRRARDRRRDATRVDVATDAIIDLIARSSSPVVSMRRSRRASVVSSTTFRTNERTNERTRARGVFARSASRVPSTDVGVDCGRRRTPRLMCRLYIYMHTVYPYELHLRRRDDRRNSSQHGITHRPSTIPRDHTHRETRPDSSSSSVGRRSASRVDARVAPRGSSRLMIGGLSCPSPIDES